VVNDPFMEESGEWSVEPGLLSDSGSPGYAFFHSMLDVGRWMFDVRLL